MGRGKIGVPPLKRDDCMWTQSMGFPAKLKAMHMDAWQWTAALTSGRALKISL